MKILKIIFLFILIESCNKKEHSTESQTNDFEFVKIELSGQRIGFTTDSDSATSLIFTFVKTSDSVISTNDNKTKKNTFFLSKAEKTEIIRSIKTLLNDPPIAESYCSDYVGNISFILTQDQVTRTCTFNSICSWKQLPKEAKSIMDILVTKTKIKE